MDKSLPKKRQDNSAQSHEESQSNTLFFIFLAFFFVLVHIRLLTLLLSQKAEGCLVVCGLLPAAVDLAVSSVLVALEVGLSPGSGGGPVARALKAKVLTLATGDTGVSTLSPVLTPGVAHHPVGGVAVHTPAHNGDDVVDATTLLSDDSSVVVVERHGIDTTGDGTTGVDLSHHLVSARDGSVLGNGGVGELADGSTEPSACSEGGAGAADVVSLAGGVDVLAESLRGLLRACNVR